MPDLDIRTLSLLAMTSSLLLAAGLQLVHRVIAGDASLQLWARGASASGAGYVLFSARGAIPDLLSIIAGNTLLLIGTVWLYLGNRKFRELSNEFPWYWILTGAAAAAIYFFTYSLPSLSARIVTMSAATSAVFVPSSRVLLRSGDHRDRVVRWSVGLAFLAYAVFMGVRAVATLFFDLQGQDFMLVSSPINTLSIALAISMCIILGIGLPLLVSGKLRQQVLESSVTREVETRKLLAGFAHVIERLATAVERRDPYIAGHQVRVAALAAAIARSLGLDPARIEGLYFAGTIHDIGMIYVPLEILSRPGKLPPMEFELIKSHVGAGSDIIKSVEFPWPVGDMVRQHHERLDGSGYPQGLKGGQILLEARILAVADTVEAMTSHRPSRPAVALDAALAQIRQEAGTKLDAQAVNACERLFREQGFSFGKR